MLKHRVSMTSLGPLTLFLRVAALRERRILLAVVKSRGAPRRPVETRP